MKKIFGIFTYVSILLLLCSCSNHVDNEADLVTEFNEENQPEEKDTALESETALDYQANEGDLIQASENKDNKYNLLVRDYDEKVFILGPIDGVLGLYYTDGEKSEWIRCFEGDVILGPIYHGYLYYMSWINDTGGDAIILSRMDVETYQSEDIYSYDTVEKVFCNHIEIFNNCIFMHQDEQLENGIFAQLDEEGKIMGEFCAFEQYLGDAYIGGEYFISSDYRHLFYRNPEEQAIYEIDQNKQFVKERIEESGKIRLVTDQFIVMQSVGDKTYLYDYLSKTELPISLVEDDCVYITCDENYIYTGRMENDLAVISRIDNSGKCTEIFELENVSFIARLGLSVTEENIFFYDSGSNVIINMQKESMQSEIITNKL